MLTDEQLNEIEARAEAATPGPWESLDDGDRLVAWKIGPGGFDDDFDYVIDEPIGSVADAEFIAHAREDVPALLAEVKRLQAAKRVLRRSCEALTADRDRARKIAVALEQENARLTEQMSNWSAARDIVERAVRKGYDISGAVLDDLAEAFGLNGGEDA